MTGISVELQEIVRRFGVFVSLVIVLVIIGLTAIGLHSVFASAGNFIVYDFQSPLIAARAVLSGIDPYSERVTSQIQALVYGRAALPTEDALAFAYPVYVAYLLTPLTYLPLPWAQSIWLSILLAAALAGVFLCIKIWGWPKKQWSTAIILLWSITFYPLVWALILGQIAVLVFASLALALWAMLARRDLLAGIALSLSLIKPNLSLVLVIGILIFAALTRRIRLLGTAVLGISVLVLSPMIANPAWPVSFVQRLGEYLGYTPFVPPVSLLGDLCCRSAANAAAAFLSVLLIGAAVYGWRNAVRSRSDQDVLWAAGITLIATAAIAPRFAIVNQIILLIPAIGLFKALAKKGTKGALSIALLMALWSAGLWILSVVPPISVASPRYPVEHRVLSPILPASMALLWIVIKWLQDQRMGSPVTTAPLPEPSDAR